MFFRQLELLLWKNFTIRRRHPIRTIIEIFWPILLFSILIIVRTSRPAIRLTECHYPARALPSAGVFPWIQTMFCNLDNPCFNVPVASEKPGQINDPLTETTGITGGLRDILDTIQQNTTFFNEPDMFREDIHVLTVMLREITKPDSVVKASISALMKDPVVAKAALINDGLSSDLAETILQSELTITQIIALNAAQNKKALVCNEIELATTLMVPATAPLNVSQMSDELCQLNNTQLDSVWSDMQQGADFEQFLSDEGTDLLIEAGANSGLDQFNLLIFVTFRLPALLEELKEVGGSVAQFMTSLQAGESGNTMDFFTALIGYDLSKAEGFQKFCGHPEPRAVYGQLFLGQMFTVIMALSNRPEEEFCTAFVNTFENNDNLGFVWNVLKPILFGKVPFSPDTPLTRDIMSRSNTTFGAIAQMESLSKTWIDSAGPAAYDFMENDPTLSLLRIVLDSGLNLTSIFDVGESDLQSLNIFLSNSETGINGSLTWKMIYRQLDFAVVLIHKMLSCANLDKFEGYPDEAALVERSLDLLANNSFWAGIVFISPSATDTTLPKHIKYKIRQDVDDVMRTDFIKTYFWEPGPGTSLERISYLINGFADMQDMMEHGISKVAADWYGSANVTTQYYGAVPKLGYYLQQMPYPCYTSDKFLEYLGNMMSLLMTLAWIYSVCITIKNIVYEKEQRLKEFMKMMGLSNAVHWLAWFINSFYLMVLSSILLVVVLNAGNVMPYSNPFIVFLWLICFCLATISQCFLISCFFTRANLAAACGGIIYFLLYIPYNFAVGWDSVLSFGGKIGLSLFSTVSFGYGAGFITSYEMSGDGIQFSNWNKNPVPGDRYTFLISMLMMLLDALIYFIMAWYVENVFPGKYGIPRPPYFMFTQSYWCGTPTKSPKDINGFSNPNCERQGDQGQRSMLEEEPEHLPLGVSVQNLTKIYNNGNKLAVDDLSLNFYEGHITSFLGHNGAGKTTTMSILCGLFTPTHGTAYVHGNDIRTDMETIRNSLGMCPQHNVLFRDLTVQEHLDFYAGLRGAPRSQIPEDTDRMLQDVGLPHKRKEVVHNLSGGMKRKLSVAVAFIGNSKTVILDEPTAGVDPYARRGIWDLLLKYKQGRTIILSTHHMDEADLLGDRIAIISQGRLKCCGSSLFLKSTFGVGYYLTLVKQRLATKGIEREQSSAAVLNIPSYDSVAASEDEGFSSKPSSSKASSVTEEKPADLASLPELTVSLKEAENIVRSVIPNAKMYEENMREITFILPYEAIQEGRYTELFQALDNSNLTYGLTDTSLEEIFLTVADHAEESVSQEDKTCQCCRIFPRRERHSSSSVSPSHMPENNGHSNGNVELLEVKKLSSSTESITEATAVQLEAAQATDDEEQGRDDAQGGISGKGSYQIMGKLLILQQFVALMIKRFHHARRNRKGIFAQIILPSAFVLIALCFTLLLPPNDGQPSLEMQPWMYGEDLYTFYSDDSPQNSDSSTVSSAFINEPGIGTRCVKDYSIKNYDGSYLKCEPEGASWETNNDTKSSSQFADSTTYETCSCTGDNDRILLAECPNGAGGSPTPSLLTNTTDILYNMTGRDVADWLVKTTDRFIEKRYGGLSIGEKYHSSFDHATLDSLTAFLAAMNVTMPSNDSFSIFFENMWRTENGLVWFDNNGFHAMPAWLNILSNSVLRSEIPAGEDPAEYAITVYNHPMNYTKTQISQAALMQTATDTAIAVVVVFAMSFIPASFVIFLIDERVTKAKHLQFISGVNQIVYWIANFVWDMVNYLVPAIIVTIIFICFQTEAYVSARNLPCLILLLLLYGWSITPMMYPFSFVFNVSSTAYVVLTCINLFIGINTSIATLILQLLDDDEHLQMVNDILQKVFLIFPHYCLGRGLIDLAVNQAYADAYSKFGVDTFVNPLSWDMAGKNLAAMAIEGVVFFCFNLLVQYRFFIRPRVNTIDPKLTKEATEEDVVAEKNRVLQRKGDSDSDILRITNLSKVYKKLPLGKGLLAVDKMTVGVSKGECFGLLGVNGAGKTTTFKMLTGDETATAGDATVQGMSIRKELRAVQQNTGYCPQFDALNSHLTGFEHLQMYARLRGVPKEEIDRVAAWGIAKLGLKQYAHKPAGTYSGGNKRKLSAAIAFIGCPPVIFLDEPTAGMDPRSRRFLWKRISDVVKAADYNDGGNERCVVLTSHSMEECEALCTRLAIMVNGRFMCLGTPQHLKNKYGKGYTVTVRVGGLVPNLDNVQRFLLDAFPGAALKERHHNMIVFQLPLEVVRLAEVFDLLESHKANLQVEDYSISQTTLDEVFVNFAKHQTDGIEAEETGTVSNAAYVSYEMAQASALENPINMEKAEYKV